MEQTLNYIEHTVVESRKNSTLLMQYAFLHIQRLVTIVRKNPYPGSGWSTVCSFLLMLYTWVAPGLLPQGHYLMKKRVLLTPRRIVGIMMQDPTYFVDFPRFCSKSCNCNYRITFFWGSEYHSKSCVNTVAKQTNWTDTESFSYANPFIVLITLIFTKQRVSCSRIKGYVFPLQSCRSEED